MFNNDDIMSKLDDVLEDIDVLIHYTHRLNKPQIYVVDVEAITLDTYTLIDFVKSFNESLFYGKNLYLFIDKDKAIEYLKDLEIKNGIKELIEVDDE